MPTQIQLKPVKTVEIEPESDVPVDGRVDEEPVLDVERGAGLLDPAARAPEADGDGKGVRDVGTVRDGERDASGVGPKLVVEDPAPADGRRETERDRERQRQTERDRDRQRQRERERERENTILCVLHCIDSTCCC